MYAIEVKIFKAIDLAKYLNYLHNIKYKCNISPLKLQKVLFFLFGEWGAFVQKATNDNDGKELIKFSKYLFDEEIEAWVYGPVVSEVYRNFNNETLSEEEIFDNDELKYVGHFINDLASELFELSDFRLVEISHQMECWQKSFDSKATFHNTSINKDDIINEFSKPEKV